MLTRPSDSCNLFLVDGTQSRFVTEACSITATFFCLKPLRYTFLLRQF